MTRLTEALERAHALREQNRLDLQADAPACRLEEAPLPPLPPPLLESDAPELESPPHANEGIVRVAIFAVAGLVLVLLFAWYLVASQETSQPAKPAGMKLEYQINPKK